ncbi:MAG: GDP-L-fucose synthase [Candidatus Pacebacteria bacterium]|nr:GDP-L-fucose synthase [Candidatus Paceibacterota bacterium]
MNKDSKIFLAGHRGLVGSAILRLLKKEGYTNILIKSREELDLLDDNKVKEFFQTEKPDYVFLAAAKVGGIVANSTKPAEFIYENLKIEINVIHNSYLSRVKKLLFLGSSCIYPKLAKQPIKEEYLLSDYLEKSNIAYAVAKIAGIVMAQKYNEQYGTNFICAMPSNLYGLGDNFNLNDSHVLPALIRKFHQAKENQDDSVELWGTGTPKREFIYIDDLAEACLFLMNNYNESEIVNIGVGEDFSIKELAEIIKEEVGFMGDIKWDTSKPDGTSRKLLDVSKIKGLGWEPKTGLREGIKKTYSWFLGNLDNIRK